MTGIIIASAIYAVAIWISMQITSVKGPAGGIVAVVIVSSLLRILGGGVGIIIRVIVLGLLMSKVADADFYPDAIIVIIIAEAVTFALTMALFAMLI